jgi:probable F420-dependent oxidoreductase
VRLGFALPHLGPVASAESIRAVALEAERIGYHSVWTLDRVIKALDQRTPYPGTPDGKLNPEYDTVFEHLSVLTYVAALTERVRLGVSVLNLPFYQPVLLAKRIATLDQLSGGRVDVGIGVGWSRDEFHAAGQEFERRGRQTEEYIRALHALWADDPVEFHGELVDIPPAIFGPKPVQKPHPPLYIGAFTEPALRRGGRLADGFTGCCAPADDILTMRSRLIAAANAAGRDGSALPTVVRCNLHRTEEMDPDPHRPIGHGTWGQIREDVLRLQEGGVDEVFFDVSFQPGCDDLGSVMDHLSRLRGILERTP